MEQQQVQQLQLQAAVDSLKRVIDGLLQEGMNLSAQVSVLGVQLQEALKKEQMLNKLIASLQDQVKELTTPKPAEASVNESK